MAFQRRTLNIISNFESSLSTSLTGFLKTRYDNDGHTFQQCSDEMKSHGFRLSEQTLRTYYFEYIGTPRNRAEAQHLIWGEPI